MTNDKTPKTETVNAAKVRVAESGGKSRVSICSGTACVFAGSMAVYDAFVEEVKAAGISDRVEVSIIGCHGLCSQGPIAVVTPEDTYYPKLKPDQVAKVVTEHLVGGVVVEKLLYKHPQTKQRVRDYKEIDFYKHQQRIALRDVGVINPERIEEYIARGGYESARMVLLEKTPTWVIEEVTASGIRGRGGAGFPTGVKWKFANASPGDVKYFICNGDEGDPGAFMDASIMDGDPHAVLEGMIIGAFAIGAREGYIYVRAEYPLAVRRLKLAIAAAEKKGFLQEHLRQRVVVRPAHQGGRRRLRVW